MSIFTFSNILICLILLQPVLTFTRYKPKYVSNVIKHNINFLFHKGPTVNDYDKIPYKKGLSIVKDPTFNSKIQTVFYLPGWTVNPTNNIKSVDTIVEAFLKRKDSFNIIVVDYSSLVQGESVLRYVGAVMNITSIGHALGVFLKNFIPKKQKPCQVHLIGHSLGTQIMSKTAATFGKGKLHWLTGLDPAGPYFTLPFVEHFSKDDGVFVDVIHTDAGFYGDFRSLGHADFYPNMGTRVQPYCTNDKEDFCSHYMSWKYYAESIINEKAFPAKKCLLASVCDLFHIAKIMCCPKNAAITHMGLGVDKHARGNFYLKTNNKPPFDMGEDGLYV